MRVHRVAMGAPITVLACVSMAVAPAAVGASSTAASKKPSSAEIRVVQVYAPPDGSQPTITVVDSQASTGKKKPKPLLDSEFGEVSDFIKVPTGHSLQLGASGEDSTLFIDPLKKGDRLTLIPYATSDDPTESGMQMLTIVERGKRQKAGDVAEWPKVPSSQATVMFFPAALMSIDPDFGGYVVVPGTGCAQDVDESAQGTGTGGNVPEFFVLDATSTDVGISDSGCDGSPTIGPETVDASAGDRIALIPYGTSTSDLQLLVLDVGGGA
jgi:hypothetical protein